MFAGRAAIPTLSTPLLPPAATTSSASVLRQLLPAVAGPSARAESVYLSIRAAAPSETQQEKLARAALMLRESRGRRLKYAAVCGLLTAVGALSAGLAAEPVARRTQEELNAQYDDLINRLYANYTTLPISVNSTIVCNDLYEVSTGSLCRYRLKSDLDGHIDFLPRLCQFLLTDLCDDSQLRADNIWYIVLILVAVAAAFGFIGSIGYLADQYYCRDRTAANRALVEEIAFMGVSAEAPPAAILDQVSLMSSDIACYNDAEQFFFREKKLPDIPAEIKSEILNYLRPALSTKEDKNENTSDQKQEQHDDSNVMGLNAFRL